MSKIIGSPIALALCATVQAVHLGTTCFTIRGQDAGPVGRKVGILRGLLKV